MKNEIFESNPQLKEVHVTTDGQCFYNEHDAKMHAKSLEDKKVELVLNPDHLEVVSEAIEEDSNEEEATGASATDAPKEEVTADALAIDDTKEEVTTAGPATEEAPKVVKPSKNAK